MKQADIIAIQKRIGTTPDGFWGPQSIAACQRHLQRLMPVPNPWPKQDQASLQSFYGTPGDESQFTTVPVTGLGVKYDGKPVAKILCHKKVADSLLRVLTALSKFEAGQRVLGQYAGMYNNRPMRGGSTPSLHARAAAIDLDPDTNGNRMSWPVGSSMPLEVMEEFAKEGWVSAGAFWQRDGMHHQATQ